MEHAAGLRAQVDQLEGFQSLLDDASIAVELLDLEVRFLIFLIFASPCAGLQFVDLRLYEGIGHMT